MNTKKPIYNISSAERETGLSKETLRIWEQRYGFPKPSRTSDGNRLYSDYQVEQLKIIKRLIDTGHKTNKIVGLSLQELKELTKETTYKSPLILSNDDSLLLKEIKTHNPTHLKLIIENQINKSSARDFIFNYLKPKLTLIGLAWAHGLISIDEEHFFSEVLTQSLYKLADQLEKDIQLSHRVVLTTPPGETHSLGIHMVRLLCLYHGLPVLYLGPQTPVSDLVSAALKAQAKIVGIGISTSYSAPKAKKYLEDLRKNLNPEIEIWAGGTGADKINLSALKIKTLTKLEDLELYILNFKSSI